MFSGVVASEAVLAFCAVVLETDVFEDVVWELSTEPIELWAL